MQAVMLAAGMGKRLGKYTQNATKCMVPVNGKTLIEYAIDALVAAGIKKFTLVVGYKGDVLKEFLKGKEKGLEINFIDNPVFNTTNNIYSLFLASDVLKQDDTILLESDLIYDPKIITELVQNPEKNLAVVSPFEAWMDGTVTLLDDKKDIIGMLGKSEFVWQNKDNYYKTVNIYKFSKEFISNTYLPFLSAYQQAFGKNEYYETVLKVVSFLDNTSLKAHVVDGSRWYEIDDPADLEIAKTRFSKGKEHLNMMQKRYGGYWRFPSMLDFCYLVNPYFPPEQMVNEMSSNFGCLLTQYPSGAAQESLLAAKIFNVSSEHIAVGNGAAELISSLGALITGKAVVPYPTFNEYPERFINAETVPVFVDEVSFKYTANDIIDSVKKSGAKTVLLINPDNPTGNFLSKDEVLNLTSVLETLGSNLIFDESFIDFAQKEKRYTLLDETILQEHKNLIVVKSISKSYGVPGLRLGVLACNNCDYIKTIQKKNAIWNINSFGEYFLQIYDKYNKLYAAACDKIAFERNRFANELSKINGLFVFPSEANFVLVRLDCKIMAEELTEKLLEENNIFIKDLSSKKCFESGKYIRLAVRNQNDNDKLLEVLRKIIR